MFQSTAKSLLQFCSTKDRSSRKNVNVFTEVIRCNLSFCRSFLSFLHLGAMRVGCKKAQDFHFPISCKLLIAMYCSQWTCPAPVQDLPSRGLAASPPLTVKMRNSTDYPTHLSLHIQWKVVSNRSIQHLNHLITGSFRSMKEFGDKGEHRMMSIHSEGF